MNSLILDVYTRSKPNIIRRLDKLSSTVSVQDGGAYWMDPSLSQVHLETTKTVDEVEDWLYNLSGDYTDYIGVVDNAN